MHFEYQGWPIDDPDDPDAIALRPTVLFWLRGPNPIEPQVGILDTGADDVYIPEHIGYSLGFLFAEEEKVPVSGIIGGIRAAARVVNISMTDGTEAHTWSARVWFHEGSPDKVLLGRTGFLDHFYAIFDGLDHRVSLEPNNTFPEPFRFAQ